MTSLRLLAALLLTASLPVFAATLLRADLMGSTVVCTYSNGQQLILPAFSLCPLTLH